MPRTGTFQLMRLFGIRIGVSTSWFFILFFFIYVLSGYYRDVLNSSQGTAYALAVASALAFYTSLILHELGHALVARRLGIQIAGIDLWFFGGIAKMNREPDTPRDDFLVAVAGPLVTLAVIAICVAAGAAIGGVHHFYEIAVFNSGTHQSAGLVLLGWLVVINAFVFVFNLVPAFPLDGGRIARAAAWRITGDRNRGTRASARLGQAFAYLLMGLGVSEILFRYSIFGAQSSFIEGLWFLLIGMFLGSAARGAVMQSNFSDSIGRMTVADVMDREPVAIPADTTLLQAEEEYFMRYRWPWFAVVDQDRHYLGPVRIERVQEEIAAGRPALTVADVVDADEARWRVDEHQPLEAVLGSEGLRRLGAVVAVDGDGVLQGVVTLAHVRRALTPLSGV